MKNLLQQQQQRHIKN